MMSLLLAKLKRKESMITETRLKRTTKTSDKTELFFDHCKIHGHIIDKCWKIHGYPSTFKSNTWKKDEGGTNKAYMASSDSMNQGSYSFTQEQYRRILQLLNKQQQSTEQKDQIATASSAQLAGNHCFLAKKSTIWIIDTGASDHICSDPNFLDTSKSLSNKGHYITIADGRQVKVACVGSVKLRMV